MMGLIRGTKTLVVTLIFDVPPGADDVHAAGLLNGISMTLPLQTMMAGRYYDVKSQRADLVVEAHEASLKSKLSLT